MDTKGKSLLIKIVSIALIALIPMASADAVTKPKAAGRTAASIPNTILSGFGAPSNAIGIDGDFYIDTKNLNIYGPKMKKKWPKAVSLKGSNGLDGTDGKSGSDGKTVTNASTVAGPSGVQGFQGAPGDIGPKGEQGLRGEVGATGEQGVAGPAGAQGSIGLTGAIGIQGPAGFGSQGAPGATGATGAQGTSGAAGGTGLTGNVGATGAKGDQGIQGENGFSQLTWVPILTWNLSTSVPGAGTDSPSFASLAIGETYYINISVHGISSKLTGYFTAELIPSSTPTFFMMDQSVSEANVYNGISSSHTYSFVLHGVITVGASVTSFTLRVSDGAGITTSYPMTLIGKAAFVMVGSIA